MKENMKSVDKIDVIKSRFQLMTLSRYRNKEKIKKASDAIDEIREKIGKKGASMTKTIREWRKKRYGPFSA